MPDVHLIGLVDKVTMKLERILNQYSKLSSRFYHNEYSWVIFSVSKLQLALEDDR